MSEFKISLKAARVNAGFTLDEAASKLHTTKQTLIKYEKGETYPTVDKMIEICHLYGVRLESILFLPKESNLI